MLVRKAIMFPLLPVFFFSFSCIGCLRNRTFAYRGAMFPHANFNRLHIPQPESSKFTGCRNFQNDLYFLLKDHITLECRRPLRANILL